MKKKFLWLVILGALALSACGPSPGGAPPSQPGATVEQSPGTAPETSENPTTGTEKGASEVQKISAEQAYQMMRETEGYILLDVRTKEEFDQKHIEGAVLIPDTEIRSSAEAKLPDKDAVILVYCRTGRRSALAAGELAAMGYANIYDFGGIVDWPYDTVSVQ
ncbi:MAG: rhodanese-like domain-containing protein [Bacillota bacterium]